VTSLSRFAEGSPARRRALLVLLAVGVGLLTAVNLYLAARSIGNILAGHPAVDWEQYGEAGRRVTSGGDLYESTATYGFYYSPALAVAFSLLTSIGTIGWRLLHVVAAMALPTWPLRLVTLASWPFWYDTETGNFIVFVLLAAAWALRGSRVATGTYLVLLILVPRPLMIPVAAWLLWQRPEWRLPFGFLLVVHVVAVFVTGWAGPWLVALMAAGGDVAIPSNVGPSRFIGAVPWLIVGLPLAAWLTWRGRLGVASLAASPYWLPYYLLMPILELVQPLRREPEAPRP
jgi:hypothetical protein